MTAIAAPSLSQIKALVATIREKVPEASVIGIRSPARWTGLCDDGQEFIIYQCDSPLSFRSALRQPVEKATTKILVTSLNDQDLGDDIRLRLAKRRLFQIDAWQIVRSLFDANAVDPRLTEHPWIAESLLALTPAGGYPSARGGFLDADTAWPLLLDQSIGLGADALDITTLLKWSLHAESTARFRQSPKEFRKGAIEWITRKAGPAAELILRCIEHLDRPDAVPIGLAAGVVFHPSAIGKLERAAGKLEERYFGGHAATSDQLERWSRSAVDIVRALRSTDIRACRQVTQRFDEILTDIQADGMAFLSDVSPLGFDQRLAQVGRCLSQVQDAESPSAESDLDVAIQSVGEHDRSAIELRRMERLEMAVRLVRWQLQWKQSPTTPPSFADAADRYLREGGYVDWARLSLRSGDPVRELSESYARVFERTTEVRQRQSETFAQLLRHWTNAGSQGSEVIPVERILDEIVAPLADDCLVLLVLIDGMSVAVARELLADATRHEWILISEPGRRFNRPGIATIPSVTEYSRTSLLCGSLRKGNQDDERAGFARHTGLVARSRSGSPPILFHKAALSETEDSVLAGEVRKEIASTHRRIVGVVVNAVDDHLLKGEQIDTRWSRDEIKVLPALLHEARIARRIVVLVSDHGHVLDCHSESRPCRDEAASGERWRSADGAPGHDEVLVEGTRVLTQGKRIIAPWSERIRYGIKKNGYHGGLTPQEMIVPIAVLSSTDELPKGWHEQPIDTPVWWDEPTPAPVMDTVPIPALKAEKPQPSGMLFDLEERDANVAARAETLPIWLSRLLSSPVFADQKRLGGRGIPPDDVIVKLLVSLVARGGKLTSAGLARALEYPAFRLPGLVAKAARILNVDGYDVLRRDDAADTIALNLGLLLKQFDLSE